MASTNGPRCKLSAKENALLYNYLTSEFDSLNGKYSANQLCKVIKANTGILIRTPETLRTKLTALEIPIKFAGAVSISHISSQRRLERLEKQCASFKQALITLAEQIGIDPEILVEYDKEEVNEPA